MKRIVRNGDRAYLVEGTPKGIGTLPEPLPNPSTKKQRFAPSSVRIKRTGPQIKLDSEAEARLLVQAKRGNQGAIDMIFKAYIGIINVIVDKYARSATDDDVQDAYLEAVTVIRTHDLSRCSLGAALDSAIRRMFSNKRRISAGTDALDYSVSLENPA